MVVSTSVLVILVLDAGIHLRERPGWTPWSSHGETEWGRARVFVRGDGVKMGAEPVEATSMTERDAAAPTESPSIYF